MKSKVLSSLLAFVTITILGGESFAQKKSEIAYFSREVTIKDSITLSLIDQYIEKVPEKKVIRLRCAGIAGAFHYQIEAIGTFEDIEEHIKPFFLFQYKDHFVLIDNGMGRLLHQNDRFPKYLSKKLKKYLVKGYTEKNDGEGVKLVSHLIYEPPIMTATFSKDGLKIEWGGL